MSVRRNLVIVRAGEKSLHPLWLVGGENRNWDLVVSCYDPCATFDHGSGVRVVFQPGGKWDGLYGYLNQERVLDEYDYVWLPDDDLETTSTNIDAIFDAMRFHELDVAQPALARDSYYTHFALIACPGFRLRYVNFVEIMAPCLKTELLALVVKDFDGSMSGFGLDYIWCRLSPEPRYKAAILDEIAIRHTRPVGKGLRRDMARQGFDAEEEECVLRARYSVKGRTRPLVYAAIDAEGRLREGCIRLGMIMAWRYLNVFGDFTAQEGALRHIIKLIRRQIMRRPDLTRLEKRIQTPPERASAR